MDHFEGVRDLLNDPTVQSVLQPLMQSAFLMLAGWKALTVAYSALVKACANFKSKPVEINCLTRSLLNSLEGEAVLSADRASIVTAAAEFMPETSRNYPCVKIGKNDKVLELIPKETERRKVARKIGEVHKRLVAEAEANDREQLAMEICGVPLEVVEEPTKTPAPPSVPVLASAPGARLVPTWRGPHRG